MKWVCLVALVLALLWRSSAQYATVLQFLVCAGAVFVAVQSIVASRYLWAAAFVGVALLFNPVMPIELTRNILIWRNLACLAMFLVSLWLANKPRLSIASVTDLSPRGEAL
jgi:hypothetical protein